MYKNNDVDRFPTGEYREASIGEAAGQVGEIVKHWGWGGVDLIFPDGAIITYANGDVTDAGVPDFQNTETIRRCLVKQAEKNRPIWKGEPARIAGWKNPDYATISTSDPGFYRASWESIYRVMHGQSTLDDESVWLGSRAWLGAR